MTSIRLLPIVIFAAVALLLFKGVGLLTNGGYVLLGTTTVEAASTGVTKPAGEAGGDGTPSMLEPTMSDTSPMAEDTSPTLPLAEEAPGHGAAVASSHSTPSGGEAGAEAEVHSGGTPAAAGHSSAATPTACPTTDGAAVAQGGGHDAAPAAEVACDPGLLTADGDAVPTVQGPDGKIVPFSLNNSSENAVIERLGERRGELDAREQELEMRLALVEAAEKRINERTALLEQLEARINALVEQNNSQEVEQFKSIVSMYESMKPKEAALIFDRLDMNTLLRVARAMSPRKMAPIMAKMDPVKAKDLTATMAVAPVEPTVAVTSEDLAALPQIIGQ
jgi:flagellar motility protein MotE (MotC chaperone)